MRILAETKNIKVTGDFEVVTLDSKDESDLVIGDFWGDPEGAIIDWNERWIAMYGCGIIIYKLGGLNTPYSYNTPCDQWIELFRDSDKEKQPWIVLLEQIEENKIRFCTDLQATPMIYDFDTETLELTEVLKRK